MWQDGTWEYWRLLEADLLWSEGTRVVFLEDVGLARGPVLGRQRTRCVEMYSICGIHSSVCCLFTSSMAASATTRALSVTWTAKVTKAAVRRLWSREVLFTL